ncbi:30S ribosomal protein S2 [Candidatus Kaiserbacteria bacterium]|nr:30S ribosomal protein S2 [Candidatus Kaiserbacteria bacterium]
MVTVQALFDAGAHFALTRARRHPSASPFIYATKDRTDIFDLEETSSCLERARSFVRSLAGRPLLFVGGKHEVSDIVKMAALRAGAPYVAGRWIGGTLTNFKNVRKRIDRLQSLMDERERGALEKYTKRERLLIDREIDELLVRFGGLQSLTEFPAALVVVDTRHENTAVREARQLGIPVVGLSSSDCDFSLVKYPIPANDTSVKSVRLVCDEIAEAYLEGKKVKSQ